MSWCNRSCMQPMVTNCINSQRTVIFSVFLSGPRKNDEKRTSAAPYYSHGFALPFLLSQRHLTKKYKYCQLRDRIHDAQLYEIENFGTIPYPKASTKSNKNKNKEIPEPKTREGGEDDVILTQPIAKLH